ncbi:PadR family transcriptional regulator, partial [Agathobaculum sp.]
ERQCDRTFAGHEGDLYPLLHRLEERGDIRSRERMNGGRPRRWYRLTRQGTKTLARCRREWEHYRRKCSSLAAGGETCARR